MQLPRPDREAVKHPPRRLGGHGVHRFEPPTLGASPRAADIAQQLLEARMRAEAEGRAAGLEAGYAEGMRRGEAEMALQRAEHAEVMQALQAATAAVTRAAQQLDAADRLVLHEMQRSIAELALELAESIVGHEVHMDGAALAAVQRAAALVPGREPVSIRVHPDDVVVVRDAIDSTGLHSASSVSGDPALGRGECVLEAGPCRIEHQVGKALERMRTVVADCYGASVLPFLSSSFEQPEVAA